VNLTAEGRAAGRLAAVIGTLGALLLFAGVGTAAAEEREAPMIEAAYSNAPRVITVEWDHRGPDVYGYAIQLQEGEEWQDAVPPLDHTFGRYVIAGLEPKTWYILRVCAIYGPAPDTDRECSEPPWRVQTQPPEQPPGDVVASLVPPGDIRLSATADVVRVDWGPTGRYDKILVRLDDDRGNHDQRELRNHPNGSLEFEGMRPSALYRVILKGCNGRSATTSGGCGPWSADLFITTLPPDWRLIDNNGSTLNVTAGGGNVYQMHESGHVWKYTGTPMVWDLIDENLATRQIVADGGELFQLHENGAVWKYTGTPKVWQLLSDPGAIKIAAASGNVYKLHHNGNLLKYPR
jgi:hypothetical protein